MHVCQTLYAIRWAQAKVLGFETRNIKNDWLQPLGLRNSPEPPTTAGTAGSLRDTASPGRSSAPLPPGSPAAIHYNTLRDFVQLSPHYGPGQNTPKQLACLRTTKSLQHLGRTAIFSQNPYVDSALETLLHAQVSALGAMPCSTSHSDRRLTGRLPRKGAKAAAMQRARMLVSVGASFRTEVPFADAVRVCNVAGDRTAMPGLLGAYIFSKPKLPLSKLEYYMDVLSMQPPLVQLQVRPSWGQQSRAGQAGARGGAASEVDITQAHHSQGPHSWCGVNLTPLPLMFRVLVRTSCWSRLRSAARARQASLSCTARR